MGDLKSFHERVSENKDKLVGVGRLSETEFAQLDAIVALLITQRRAAAHLTAEIAFLISEVERILDRE